MSLALRAGAHGNNDFAINIQFAVRTLGVTGEGRVGVDDLRLSEIVGSGIERGADANPEDAAFSARLDLLLLPVVPTDQVFRNFQHLRIVAGIVHAAVGCGVRKLFRTDVVAQAHFVRCNANFVAADVDDALQEPEVLHARVSAIGADGALVADGLYELDTSVLEAIRTAEHLGINHAAQGFVARISAAIINVPGSDRGDHPVLVEGDTRVAESALVSVRARGHVPGAGFRPFHRTSPGLLGSQRAHRHLRIVGDLNAEAAADIGGLHANAINMDREVGSKKLNRK